MAAKVFSLIFGVLFNMGAIVHAEDANPSWLDRAAAPLHLKSDEATLKFGLESRYRFEYRDDFNLSSDQYEDDAVNLFRNRLNADLKIKPQGSARVFRFFAEGQSALSAAESSLQKNSQFVNQLDLRQLFFELENPIEPIAASVKVGRQELSYGDERFVGPLNWTNTARVFDAVKLVFNPWSWLQTDFFYSHPVRTLTENADATVLSDHFFGTYAAYKKIKDHVIDTFLFVRHVSDSSLPGERAGKQGELAEYTFGNRFKGKRGAVDYGTEYAVQLGRRAHDEIEAWSFHQELGYTFFEAPATPRFYAEYNHASGDRNPSDGIVSSFDHLFPTNHNKYGLIDFVGLRNIHDVMLGGSIKPAAKCFFAAEFHWLFLAAKESPWFNASGGIMRAASPNASAHLGEELDLYTTYSFNKYLSLLVGYSHFFSGPFTRDTPGGDDDADFFYTQLVFKL